LAGKDPGGMTLSDLLICRVVGASGWTYGRVHDVRIERSDDEARILSLIVGRPGLKERLFGRGDPEQHPHRLGHGVEISWNAVIAIDGSTITIEEKRR